MILVSMLMATALVQEPTPTPAPTATPAATSPLLTSTYAELYATSAHPEGR